MDAGKSAQRPQVRRLAQALDARAGQGSPADLDDQVIQAAGQARDLGGKLIAQCLATLDDEPVLVLLQLRAQGAVLAKR